MPHTLPKQPDPKQHRQGIALLLTRTYLYRTSPFAARVTRDDAAAHGRVGIVTG